VELKQDRKLEEVKPKQQYDWIEFIRRKKLHEIRVKLKQSGRVLDAMNRGSAFILDRLN
jgi:hypothetical protein